MNDISRTVNVIDARRLANAKKIVIAKIKDLANSICNSICKYIQRILDERVQTFIHITITEVRVLIEELPGVFMQHSTLSVLLSPNNWKG